MQNNDELLRALLANAQSREAPAPQKRKRGGLAGLWDKRKGIIKPLVSAGLGLIPGIGVPLAAGAGALMGGFDNRNKRFDVGEGVMGGLGGAAAGGAGKFLGGKMGIGKPILGSGAGAAGSVGADLTPTALPGQSVNTATGAISNAAMPAAQGAVAGAAQGAGNAASGGGLMGALRGAGQFAKDNATAVGMGLQGASGIMGAQSERRIAEDKLAFEREREEEDRRRRAMMAQMLLPMYQQERGRMGL